MQTNTSSPRSILGKLTGNLKISQKIFLALIVPTLLAAVYIVNVLSDRFTVQSEVRKVGAISEYIVKASAVVHELQKERGTSAVYLKSKGRQMASELPARQRQTDQALTLYREFLQSFDVSDYSTMFQANFNRSESQLTELNRFRNSVQGQAISNEVAIAYYTDLISEYIQSFERAVLMADHRELSNPVAAYVNLITAKEKAGIERARMAGIAAANTALDAATLEDWMSVWKAQDAYLQNFSYLASDEVRQYFDKTWTGPVVEKVAKVRDHLLSQQNQGGFVYSGSEVFKAATDRINLLKNVEDQQAGEIMRRTDRIVASARNSLIINFVVALSAITGVFVLAYFISNPIKKQLNNVVDRIKDIAEGEGDLTVRLPVNTRDELGELSKWFNIFLEKLQDIIRQIQSSSEQVGNASEQISSASEQLATGSEEQQSQLSEVSTAIEQMSAMILESSKNSNATQESTNTANSSAQTGQQSVEQAIAGFNEITEVIKGAAEKISALEGRSQEIGDVIQVIDDIADQTNLLALNANIEAARAGDAGRGFAVVADEVRKLAERTVSATGEIGEKIKLIQEDVSGSVQAMGNTSKRAEENQAQASQSRNALEEIVRAIAEVNSAMTQIAAAADQQSTGVEEISKNVEGVSMVAKQAAGGAQELAASAEELNREVQGLNGLIGKFKV